MNIRTVDDLQRKTLNADKLCSLVGVQPRTLNNFLRKGLVNGDTFSLSDCLEVAVINNIGKGGATLRLGLLAGAPAVLRMEQRLQQRLLGTKSRLQVMVFSWSGLKSVGRGYCHGKSRIDACFCNLNDLPSVLSERLTQHERVVQQVFEIDATIESIVSRIST